MGAHQQSLADMGSAPRMPPGVRTAFIRTQPAGASGKLTREAAQAFAELTGLSLEFVGLRRAKAARPQLKKRVLCPFARQVETGFAVPAQCGECVPERWLSGPAEGLTRREYRGPCGCLWAEMELPAGQPLALLVRGAQGRLPGPAAGALRLITRQVQAQSEAESARCALQRAELRIQSLQQRDELKSPADPSPCRRCADRPLVQAMKQFAQANYHRPVQLRDVASALKMNPSYLCGVFSKCTGTTFRDYLEELRLAKACELLRDPAHRVREVAASVGFCSGAHFCRVFKAGSGLSPRQWRESVHH